MSELSLSPQMEVELAYLLTPLNHYVNLLSLVKLNLVQMGSSRTEQMGNNNRYIKQQRSYVLDRFIQHENRLRCP